jgi:hypothetical protein
MPRASADLLLPAEAPAWARGVHVAVSLERTESGLAVRYELSGQLTEILWPATGKADRKAELWRHTCFEAFVALPGANAYYEFNVAPSGDWAAYRFGGYRERLGDPEVATPPAIELRHGDERVVAEVGIDLRGLPRLRPGAALELGISAVLECQGGGALAYYALEHPAERPDFHDRRAFLVTLAPPGGRAP